MRRIFAATLILMPLAAAASQPRSEAPAPAKPACDRFGRVEQAQDRDLLRRPQARAERLDRLPAGNLHLTVERQMDGCHIPVIVRQDVGRR